MILPSVAHPSIHAHPGATIRCGERMRGSSAIYIAHPNHAASHVRSVVDRMGVGDHRAGRLSASQEAHLPGPREAQDRLTGADRTRLVSVIRLLATGERPAGG